MVLVLSGSYEQLFQYSLFSSFIFHAITALALFTLRRKQPDTPRPYRVVWYPWVPALFLVAMTGLVLNTLRERPVESLLGVGMVALGVPFFRWHRRTLAAGSPEMTAGNAAFMGHSKDSSSSLSSERGNDVPILE
jgi:APA family basic amino acid/polyamine antiporter